MPKKEDVKADVEIERKYREYRALKEDKIPKENGQRKRKSKEKHGEDDKNDKNHTDEPTTPQKPPPVVITEIGPTPQMDGRVLGIFDVIPNEIMTTPMKSPQDLTTATPSLARITTPVKGPQTPQSHHQTPTYLTAGRGPAVYTGDSPLLKRKVSRSLAGMLEELKNIQEEPVDEEFQDFELNDVVSSDDDDDEDDDSAENPDASNTGPNGKPYKKKGLKRQTRRVKSEYCTIASGIALTNFSEANRRTCGRTGRIEIEKAAREFPASQAQKHWLQDQQNEAFLRASITLVLFVFLFCC